MALSEEGLKDWKIVKLGSKRLLLLRSNEAKEISSGSIRKGKSEERGRIERKGLEMCSRNIGK